MIAKSSCALLFFLSFLRRESDKSANQPLQRPRDSSPPPVYEVFAIRYASIPDFPVNALIAGADPQRKYRSP